MEENNIKQLTISGWLGDGCLRKSGGMSFNCIKEDYLLFKSSLICSKPPLVKKKANNGYKKNTFIYYMEIPSNSVGKSLVNGDYIEILNDIDELGLALWLYDDGSLHKKTHFFNINTHSFEECFQTEVLIPLLNKFNIFPKIMTERKKDGRVFKYLYVGKYKGVYDITRILRKYPVNSYNYKLIPEDEYLRWKMLNDKFGGYKINTIALGKVIKTNTDDFESYLDTLSITENGFVIPYKESKVVEDKRTVYLKSNYY